MPGTVQTVSIPCPNCGFLDPTKNQAASSSGSVNGVQVVNCACETRWRWKHADNILLPENARQGYPSAKFPFSDELCTFVGANPAFAESLKLANPWSFSFFGYIDCSHTPETHPRHEDEVLGMWYLNKEYVCDREQPQFKQDFVVNVGKKNENFVSYTAKHITQRLNGPLVKPINDFFETDYGDDGKYYHNGSRWQHHYYHVDDLPEPVRELGKTMLERLLKPLPA